MQYSLVVETQRGWRYVYDRRSVAPPSRLDLHFSLVEAPHARRTIAPNKAFAKEVKAAFEETQRALGVSEAMLVSCQPYEAPIDHHSCRCPYTTYSPASTLPAT